MTHLPLFPEVVGVGVAFGAALGVPLGEGLGRMLDSFTAFLSAAAAALGQGRQ